MKDLKVLDTECCELAAKASYTVFDYRSCEAILDELLAELASRRLRAETPPHEVTYACDTALAVFEHLKQHADREDATEAARLGRIIEMFRAALDIWKRQKAPFNPHFLMDFVSAEFELLFNYGMTYRLLGWISRNVE